MEQTKKYNIKNILLNSLKGALIAVSVSLLSILVFAFIIKLTNMSDAMIRPINQVIKTFSIFLGTFLILKKIKQKGMLTGLSVGLTYTIIAFIVFSILNGKFNFDLTLLLDILFGGIVGAICGIICVNLKK